jgi:hypothetical protein
VVLGTLGKRESDAGDPILSEQERPVVRRQVNKVIVGAVAISIIATAVLCLL